MNMHYQKKNTGFTLVEALVAISILMIAVASPMTVAQRGLSTALLSRDQMTASFLAEDGIEAVKNIRDQVALNATPGDGTDWLLGLNNSSGLSACVCTGTANCANFTNACNIDTTYADLTVPNAIVSGAANATLDTLFDGTGSFAAYVPPTHTVVAPYTLVPSRFSRYIDISTSTTNANEAKVSVKVTWPSPSGATQNITVSDFIYNYSQNI